MICLFFVTSLLSLLCHIFSFVALWAMTPSQTPDASNTLPDLPAWVLKFTPAQVTHTAPKSRRAAKKQRLDPATATSQDTTLALQHTPADTANALPGAVTPPPILALPNDVLGIILTYYLPDQEPGALGRWRAVCRRFRDACDLVFPLNKRHIKLTSVDQFRRFIGDATLQNTLCAGMHFSATVGTQLLNNKNQQYQRAAQRESQLKPTAREEAIAAYHKRGGTVHLTLPHRMHESLEQVERLKLPLTSLNISNWYCLKSLDGVEVFSHLTHLVLRYCLQIQTLLPLSHLKNLESLSLFACNRLTTLQGIGQRNRLQIFKARKLPELQDSAGLNQCPLKVLHLDELPQLQHTSYLLAPLTQLEELIVKQCPGFDGTLSINTPHLKKLLLSNCCLLENIAFQATLNALHSIDINDCGTLQNILLLNNCKQLRQLFIKHCHSFKAFGVCGALEHVHMKDCPSFVETTPLGACQKLSRLVLEGMPHKVYDNLHKLALWQTLTHLELHDTESVPGAALFAQLKELSSSLKEVTIVPKPDNAEEIIAYCKEHGIQLAFTA